MGPPEGPDFRGPPSAASGPGDWTDVRAALEAAARRSQLAIVSSSGGDGEIEFRLVGSRGEPGRLRAAKVSGLIELEAQIGLFGDPRAEARLLRDTQRRLEQLRGVDVSPIRW